MHEPLRVPRAAALTQKTVRRGLVVAILAIVIVVGFYLLRYVNEVRWAAVSARMEASLIGSFIHGEDSFPRIFESPDLIAELERRGHTRIWKEWEYARFSPGMFDALLAQVQQESKLPVLWTKETLGLPWSQRRAVLFAEVAVRQSSPVQRQIHLYARNVSESEFRASLERLNDLRTSAGYPVVSVSSPVER